MELTEAWMILKDYNVQRYDPENFQNEDTHKIVDGLYWYNGENYKIGFYIYSGLGDAESYGKYVDIKTTLEFVLLIKILEGEPT